MEILLIMILGIALMGLALCIYMLARNEWVFRLRMRVIDENMEAYDAMPTYGEMMYKYWWVWRSKYFYSSNTERGRAERR